MSIARGLDTYSSSWPNLLSNVGEDKLKVSGLQESRLSTVEKPAQLLELGEKDVTGLSCGGVENERRFRRAGGEEIFRWFDLPSEDWRLMQKGQTAKHHREILR